MEGIEEFEQSSPINELDMVEALPSEVCIRILALFSAQHLAAASLVSKAVRTLDGCHITRNDTFLKGTCRPADSIFRCGRLKNLLLPVSCLFSIILCSAPPL